MKIFLKILMWIAIVALVVFLVLYLTVIFSGNFDNIGQLIDYLVGQFKDGDKAVAALVAGSPFTRGLLS